VKYDCLLARTEATDIIYTPYHEEFTKL